MRTEPFQWEKYQAGAKVFTRGGDEVTQLVKFDTERYSLAGVLDDSIETWTENGFYDAANNDISNNDLVLAKEEKVRFMAIYDQSGYSTLDDAKLFANSSVIGFVEINYDSETVKFQK